MTSRYKDAVNSSNIQDYARNLKKRGYFEADLDQYMGNLAGMRSMSRAVAAHKQANPDLYVISEPQPDPSEFVAHPELKDPKVNRQIQQSPATQMQTPVINISTDQEKLKRAGYTSMLPPMINMMSAIANDTDPYQLLQSRMNFPIL